LGNEVAQGIYFARLDNGKEARFIKLLKINGALNASGTTIPGGFYKTYKGGNVNEDYLVKFIDINIVNRVDYAEVTVSLPAVIHQILYESFSFTGPSQIAGVEGEPVTVAKNWFHYGTQLYSIELMNGNTWSLINSTFDSLYFATIDTTLNGQIPLELKTTALHGTVDTAIIQTNLADVIYWQGQFVDDMKYKKLLGIVEPGAGLRAEIRVNNQSFFTDSEGYFNIRLTPAANYTVKVQGIEVSGDTTTFQHTFQLAGNDQTDLIFHAAPYWPIFQMNLPLSEGYIFAWKANFEPGAGCNIEGLKRAPLDTALHWLARVYPNFPDTMTIEEQNYLASVIEDSLNSIMQTSLSIYLSTLEDSIPFFNYPGLMVWRKDSLGPAGSISVNDLDLDGLFYITNIGIKRIAPTHIHAMLQEGASGNFGPWPQTFWGKTVLSENGNPGYITLLDRWLLRLIENYEPLDDIDDILGF